MLGRSARNRSRARSPSTAVMTANPSRKRLYDTLSARAASSSTSRTFGAVGTVVALTMGAVLR